MEKKTDQISMQEALRLANSPAGKQLLALLKSAGGQSVTKAQQQASQGNYEQAKETLSEIMKSPKIQALIREMERGNG